ncbi:hypothetical protein T492DRAFT_918498 [Pavlovales sp. CCMP2436]|nr:hypothetical protein T492DRAFT_918498 [Pavlovales sp. CCMP2436]
MATAMAAFLAALVEESGLTLDLRMAAHRGSTAQQHRPSLQQRRPSRIPQGLGQRGPPAAAAGAAGSVSLILPSDADGSDNEGSDKGSKGSKGGAAGAGVAVVGSSRPQSSLWPQRHVWLNTFEQTAAEAQFRAYDLDGDGTVDEYEVAEPEGVLDLPHFLRFLAIKRQREGRAQVRY